MSRFMVERTFPDGLDIPANADGAAICATVVGGNAKSNVTWIHSYVSTDKKKTFCIYDGPDEAAIRESAATNGLPIDTITPISVLDPYFAH